MKYGAGALQLSVLRATRVSRPRGHSSQLPPGSALPRQLSSNRERAPLWAPLWSVGHIEHRKEFSYFFRRCLKRGNDCDVASGGILPPDVTSSLMLREKCLSFASKTALGGSLGGSVVWRLLSAQGVTPGSWDRIPPRAPCMEPASPSACVSASLSLSLSVSN